MQKKIKTNGKKVDKMTEYTKLWENNPELWKYFGTAQSFYTWMGQHFLTKNPTMEEIIKLAKKRKYSKSDRIKSKKEHNNKGKNG